MGLLFWNVLDFHIKYAGLEKEMRFHHIGGKCKALLSPPSLLQTDGSFKRSTGRAAALLLHNSNMYSRVWELEHAKDSYETEWASIYHGLLFSLNSNADRLHIENDNQGVIMNLLTADLQKKKKQKKQNPYVTEYREAILNLAKQTEWTAVRWIPREINRADDLFHTHKNKDLI